jgi:heme/copper-type cytochrome/quinol oxidase subunit 3
VAEKPVTNHQIYRTTPVQLVLLKNLIVLFILFIEYHGDNNILDKQINIIMTILLSFSGICAGLAYFAPRQSPLLWVTFTLLTAVDFCWMKIEIIIINLLGNI